MSNLSYYILPCVYSFAAGIAFCAQFNIRFRHIAGAAAGGFVCQLVFSAAEAAGAKEPLCCFAAALTVSLYSELLAKKLRVPVNMYLVVGIIPLVPGRYLYDTMIVLVGGDIDSFARNLADTVAIAGSVAMGVFAASSAVRALRAGVKKS